MNQQISIPFAKTSATSREAADRIAGSAATLRAQVYAFIRRHPDGVTDECIASSLKMPQNTARPRRIDLCKMGLVKDAGKRGKTISGRDAVLWVAIDNAD